MRGQLRQAGRRPDATERAGAGATEILVFLSRRDSVTLKHPKARATSPESLSVPPLFTFESTEVPRHLLSEGELPPDVAYQLIHDELMLNGNASLNVATFVTTWMEPQGEKLGRRFRMPPTT
jgi:hypothetical protein